MMCKVPTVISPIVVRFPRLPTLEGIIDGLRSDVKKAASERGHNMSTWNAGLSLCLTCGLTVEVYHVFPFEGTPKGMAYKGAALDQPCGGVKVSDVLQRVPPHQRPRGNGFPAGKGPSIGGGMARKSPAR